MKNPARSGRRFTLWRSLRLRTLLILISIAGMLCGWEANRLRRREHAVALLRQWGIYATEQLHSIDEMPWGAMPKWARDLLAPCRRAYADLSSEPAQRAAPPLLPTVGAAEAWRAPMRRDPRDATPDERRALVAAITSLTELENVQVSLELDDDDLRALSPLKDLGILGFESRRFTESGAAQIRTHRKIHGMVVNFDGPDCISVDAIAALRELTSLEVLMLNGPVSRDDVARIRAALPRVIVHTSAPAN